MYGFKKILFSVILFPIYLAAQWSTPVILGDKSSNSSHVVSDAKGNAVAVWIHTKDDGKGYSTYYISSAKQLTGQDWSPTVDIGTGLYPDIAMDREGNAFAVWYTYEQIKGKKVVHLHAAILSASSTDGWIKLKDLTLPKEVIWIAQTPEVALDEQGNATVVWGSMIGGEKRVIQAARYLKNEQKWKMISNLPVASNMDNLSFASDPKGNAVILWTELEVKGFILKSATLASNAKKWALQKSIGHSSYISSNQLVVDKNGNAVALWYGDEEDQIHAVTLSYQSLKWKKTTFPKASSYYPCLAMDADGNAYALYLKYDEITDSTTFLSTVLPKSTTHWTKPLSFHPPISNQIRGCSLGVDTNGDAIAVWAERISGLLQACCLPKGGSWSEPVTIDHLEIPESDPCIAMSPQGTVFLTYSELVKDPSGVYYSLVKSLTGQDLFK